MIFEQLVAGPLGTNCYIIGCEDTGIGAVIDPGAEGKRILSKVASLGLSCRYIILTHGHVDHIGAVGEIAQATGAQVLIHGADAERLLQPARFSILPVGAMKTKGADQLLRDGDKITVGKIILTVIHTPGHTQGGVTLQVKDKLITGDTLFYGSIGRSDLPGGNHGQLIDSIKSKLLMLPDETLVYPGHGPASKIGMEKKINPFLA